MYMNGNDNETFSRFLKKNVGEIKAFSIKESNKFMGIIDNTYYDDKDDSICIVIKDSVKSLPKNSYDKLMDNLSNQLELIKLEYESKTYYKII